MYWWVFFSFFWASSASVAPLLLWKLVYLFFWVSGASVVLRGVLPGVQPTLDGPTGDEGGGALDVEGLWGVFRMVEMSCYSGMCGSKWNALHTLLLCWW